MEHAPIVRPLPTTYLAPPMKTYKSYNEGIDEEFMEDDFEYSMEELWEFDHGYTSKSPAIVNLLEIMGEFNVDQQHAFCQFHTGAPRLPPSDLAVLNPNCYNCVVVWYNILQPTTMRWRWGVLAADDDLPSVMTCANYLKLPSYSTKLPLLKDSLRLEKPVTKMTPIVEPTNDLALLLELISSTGYCYQ
ncbi:E3 ubiquitin protein ligase UPL3-like protein [Tanacetum coccineum]